MNLNDIQIYIKYLTPAVIIAALGFFVRFLGKVISDQKPSSDDRGWEIELSGILFFVNKLLFPSVIAVAILKYIHPFPHHFINLIIFSVISSYYLIIFSILGEWRYGIELWPVKLLKLALKISKDKIDKLFQITRIINFFIASPIFIILIYIFGIEILSKNILWIIIFSIEIFISTIIFAVNYSLLTYGPLPANIYFIDKSKKPMLGVSILKVNNDNVRVKNSDIITLVNKSQIFKIEIIKEPKVRPLKI